MKRRSGKRDLYDYECIVKTSNARWYEIPSFYGWGCLRKPGCHWTGRTVLVWPSCGRFSWGFLRPRAPDPSRPVVDQNYQNSSRRPECAVRWVPSQLEAQTRSVRYIFITLCSVLTNRFYPINTKSSVTHRDARPSFEWVTFARQSDGHLVALFGCRAP